MRLAESTPRHCSKCFEQNVNVRHVDFEAAWDGPVVPGAIQVAIDDLVLCEGCLESAAMLIGLTRNDELEAERDTLARQLAETEAEVERQRVFAGHLRSALAVESPTPTLAETDERPLSELPKDELLKIAADEGVAVDGRWSPTRIAEAIATTRKEA